ncbi:MAG: hypothetical protein JWO22_1987 [Frankiales bacterium]|nr:hypothetical protein [Frankiales bacterium]
MTDLVHRVDIALLPDPGRVLGRLFVPGHEHFTEVESRATGVLGRILALDEEAVRETLADVLSRYAGRHRDVPSLLLRSYEQIAHRIPPGAPISQERRLLLGAWFTQEYSLEAAALFNPSIVAHPDQSGLDPGQRRFVLSLRAVGEGHLSSIEFRSGVVGPGAQLHLDPVPAHVETGATHQTAHDRGLFAARLEEEGADTESTRFLLSRLPERFLDEDLDRALRALSGQSVTRHGAEHTAAVARNLAQCSYEVWFDPAAALAERVLWPVAPSESHGMEDARFVQVEDGRYLATYTAYDGQSITSQLLETTDFTRFRVTQLAGLASRNKGMALFPRTVGGEHLALSRHDRETCSVTTSKDGLVWRDATPVHAPTQPWELIQTGNCGSPIETDEGWVVLTHGVGPMREYALGALLLDLDDPTVVLGCLPWPLMRPTPDEREGYVPNVVYSCGALRHGDLLLLPYGASDASIRFAFVDLPALIAQLLAEGPAPAIRANSSA